VRGGQLFAGGAGGTARLRQVIPLRSPAGGPLPAGTRYRLSAWLGGTANSRAAVRVGFVSAAGHVLGNRVIGPVGGAAAASRVARRAATGPLPAGTASARVTLLLATSATNINGYYAPYTGYDRAVADALRFSVSAAVRRPPPLVPPAAHIPRYQHVFLFYFENEDYHTIIGNTQQAPYLNSLLPRASLLGNFFAEEHPSDGNYLAIAGGSTFGVPLDDPLEENPRYTINAPNISTLIDSAHETWKAYLQSADGPCDDTVHAYYWDDDMPMTYFASVRDRPAYCAAHLLPLQAMSHDLASAATTPNFAWVAPNDCTDMEGCGIRAGDRFLASELGEIMRSPAWRTQRSLAIITFDEDAQDHQRPAQHVVTLLVGSAGVRQGYVSHVRYTHYSLLRTIEGALGLGTLTANDLYAQPVNDVFTHGPGPAAAAQATGAAGARLPSGPASGAQLAADGQPARAGAAARPASGGQQTAFVANSASNSVTPIDLVTRHAGKPIPVGTDPQAIAITPNGRTAYVANSGSATVTPIDTATRQAGPPIPVGTDPQAIAITPNGRTAYVLDWGSAAVTPISTGTGRAGRAIPVGGYPFAITIAPDGRTAYVAGYGSDTVTPITVATGRPGRPIPAGQAPDALAVTPDSRTVYAVGGDTDAVTPIGTAGGRAGPAIRVGYAPTAIAISGQTAYVVNTISGTVTPVSTSTGVTGHPISVGLYNYPTAMVLPPSGSTSVVVEPYAGEVSLIDTATGRRIAQITVGNYPVAAAIAG
jgi:YVTN family beta-propeller protein